MCFNATFQYFIYILQIFTLYIKISYLCILSEYGITLNGHNYEVEVSGVCLFVRPYCVKYHRIPSLQMYHKCSSGEGVPKKWCLYLSGAIWNRGWYPDIWLVKTCSPSSPEQLQVEPSDVPDMFLCSMYHMNHFPKYGTYFVYAHSFPFSIENQILYPITR